MRLYLILILIFISFWVSGQNPYYATDSSTFGGAELVDGGEIANAKYCQVKKGERIVAYTPYEVKEYRFENGRTYKSFQVSLPDSSSRYFLERLVKGQVNLYYLKTEGRGRMYFLNAGDSTDLVEIPRQKEEYSIVLDSAFSACPFTARNIPYIKFKKYSLRKVVRDYNHCSDRPYPRFRYGFALEMNASSLSEATGGGIYSIPDYRVNWSMSLGAYADIPIALTGLFFHPGLQYKRIGISEAFKSEGREYDLLINYSSISFPLLFRYTLLYDKFSPYVQLGPVYSRALRNDSYLYEYEQAGTDIYIDLVHSQVMQDDQAGFSFGAGLISGFSAEYALFGEIRYSKYYNLSSRAKLLNLGEITFGLGLIF